jgi:hypothetical protein
MLKIPYFYLMEIELKKQRIREWLGTCDNIDLFIQIEEIIASENETDEDRWNSLTKEQQDGLDEALESLRRGEGMTWEEVRAGIKNDLGI